MAAIRIDQESGAAQRAPVRVVSVLLRREEAVLLVKRGNPPYAGLWAFPGGKVRVGESPPAAAMRELFEETGVRAVLGGKIETIEIVRREGERAVHHFVLEVFAADWVAGEPAAADDAADAGWFTAAEWANLALTPETARLLAQHAAPGRAKTTNV